MNSEVENYPHPELYGKIGGVVRENLRHKPDHSYEVEVDNGSVGIELNEMVGGQQEVVDVGEDEIVWAIILDGKVDAATESELECGDLIVLRKGLHELNTNGNAAILTVREKHKKPIGSREPSSIVFKNNKDELIEWNGDWQDGLKGSGIHVARSFKGRRFKEEVGLHYHKKYYEVYFSYEGQGVMELGNKEEIEKLDEAEIKAESEAEVNEKKIKKLPIGPGDIIIIPPGKTHGQGNRGPDIRGPDKDDPDKWRYESPILHTGGDLRQVVIKIPVDLNHPPESGDKVDGE
jgi:mannose-6-phosphate isomerase-like protein (cupin superfamily)